MGGLWRSAESNNFICPKEAPPPSLEKCVLYLRNYTNTHDVSIYCWVFPLFARHPLRIYTSLHDIFHQGSQLLLFSWGKVWAKFFLLDTSSRNLVFLILFWKSTKLQSRNFFLYFSLFNFRISPHQCVFFWATGLVNIIASNTCPSRLPVYTDQVSPIKLFVSSNIFFTGWTYRLLGKKPDGVGLHWMNPGSSSLELTPHPPRRS